MTRCFVLAFGAALLASALIAATAFAQVPVQLPSGAPNDVHAKIHFDLSVFDDNGLYGPPDGLRSAAYEFCIPARADLAAEVAAIDPTVQISASSPGRIGCGPDEYLCIGSTGQPDFRVVLTNLAELDYVHAIELSFAE